MWRWKWSNNAKLRLKPSELCVCRLIIMLVCVVVRNVKVYDSQWLNISLSVFWLVWCGNMCVCFCVWLWGCWGCSKGFSTVAEVKQLIWPEWHYSYHHTHTYTHTHIQSISQLLFPSFHYQAAHRHTCLSHPHCVRHSDGTSCNLKLVSIFSHQLWIH